MCPMSGANCPVDAWSSSPLPSGRGAHRRSRQPEGISGVADLARADITIVNREAGAAVGLTRPVAAGCWSVYTQVNGYNHEVPSHLEVAKLWCSMADTGPGLWRWQALGLDFLPYRKNATTLSFR
jgi:molybdate-binding protein